MPEFIPYARQTIDEADIRAVAAVLRSDWLTTGPEVAKFEEAFAAAVGVRHAVAVSSGTAALHAAAFALGLKAGDEAIVPPLTFAATSNAIVLQGGTPVFCDIEPDTLLLDPEKVEHAITPRTKAIFAVDYAGQPCDYDRLRAVASRHGLALLADACHALGGAWRDKAVGSLADISIFSFHAVKHITTGEGGMVTTDNADLAACVRLFRNHGITMDHRQRAERCSWRYEMDALGCNYRLTDFQCALGLSQLSKLPRFLEQRRTIASRYDAAFAATPSLRPLAVRPGALHAYHLYVVAVGSDRDGIFSSLRREGIGVNVHYPLVHLHPYYCQRFGTGPGLCPVAEGAMEHILSLPLYPALGTINQDRVIATLLRLCERKRD